MSEGRWISVEERLPIFGERVLGWNAKWESRRDVEICRLYERAVGPPAWEVARTAGYGVIPPTHWMPLPFGPALNTGADHG